MNVGYLLAAIVGVPGLATLWLGLANWFDIGKTEESTARFTSAAFSLQVLLSLALCAVTLVSSPVRLLDVPWFGLGEYHFRINLVGDWVSAPLSLLFGMLSGAIGAFSRRYLHREPGYQRFFFLLTLFGFAIQLTVLAGSLDVVFIGWELVGLCSALLIAFFHERRKPVEHAMRAFFTYRLCDIGLLSAVVWVHHTMGTTSFARSPVTNASGLSVPAMATDVTLIGLFLLVAAIGKGGQVPLGGWLPRAMEGPTPSSAIFYGAISVHLAPFLLLRSAPVIADSSAATWAVIAIGGATALHGTFVGRVQSDVKSLLAYASMTQVGIILVEIGVGWYTVALLHMMGHASVRSLQILMSPNVLQDHQRREEALGTAVPRTGGHLELLVPRRLQPWLYRLALERGYFDALLRDFLLAPFVRGLRWIDSAERHFTNWLEGSPPTGAGPSTECTESRVTLDGAE